MCCCEYYYNKPHLHEYFNVMTTPSKVLIIYIYIFREEPQYFILYTKNINSSLFEKPLSTMFILCINFS